MSRARKTRAESVLRKRERLAALAALSTSDEFGDSEADRAKTCGLLSEVAPIFRGECLHCGDQPWRRHPDGCIGCRKPYEHERIVRPEPYAFSSIFLAELFVGSGSE
jgi:hypothetical protein